MGVIRVKIQLCFSAVRFRNYAVLLSYFAIWFACYGSQARCYGFQLRHLIITICNSPFEFGLLLLYFVCQLITISRLPVLLFC